MHAAIVTRYADSPIYGARPEPVPGAGESLLRVEAAAITQLVKAQAAGRHYSMSEATHPAPFVPGADGVGRLPGGQRVYFAFPRYPHGSMAQFAVARDDFCVAIPETLEPARAAALANPGMSSWAALTRRAAFRPGETVWILGATGASGALAIEIARALKAGRVVAFGRGAEARAQTLIGRGADLYMPLDDAATLAERVAQEAAASAPDVILDYLWGAPTEAVMQGLAKAHLAKVCRWVQIGSLAGDPARVPAALLRASPVALLGSGIGSVPLPELVKAVGEMLAHSDRFNIDFERVPLAEVTSAWTRPQRIVLTM